MHFTRFLRRVSFASKSCASNVRLTSNYKRSPNIAIPILELNQLRSNLLQNRNTLEYTDWSYIRKSLIDNCKHINDSNVDAAIINFCNEPQHLPLAKNYMCYLTASGIEHNAATLGRLLRVYNLAYHDRGEANALTVDEQNEVLQICRRLRAKDELLDAMTCEYLIYGLVTTVQWRDALQLLEMIKLTSTPSLAAYTELSIKAFSTSHADLGWQLLEEMVKAGKQPKCESYTTYLQHITQVAELEKLLYFLERYDLLVTQRVVEVILQLQSALSINVTISKLNHLGECKVCGQHMQHVSISDAEFSSLNKAFLDKVLIRQDVFQKSTPEEVQRFKHFVNKTAPYDCVIDGLNVAYSAGSKKSPHELANLLADVVRYFKRKRKNVLVLGRKHMRNWSKHAMQYVQNNAQVFLTSNLTHDDPFMLYATLKSGPNTDFFSRDLMRTHAYLLGADLKTIFQRWQQKHQYSLVTQTDTGEIIIREPIRHRLNAHKVHNIWHIPYRANYTSNPTEICQTPEFWLCLQLSSS